MTQGCTFREPLLLQCPLICFPMHARERNPVPLYPRQTKPRRWMQGPSSNHTLPLLGADFSTLHLADFPMENHTWSPGKHRLVCYKQGLDRKLSQQLTLNPPPTSPRTFSMGTLVFSKWTSQAERQTDRQTERETERESVHMFWSPDPFIRAPIPIWGLHSHGLIYTQIPPKGLMSNTITLRIRALTWILRGQTSSP